MNRDSAIAHFKSFGASCARRTHSDGRKVIGIQLRNSSITDSDLAVLKYLANEVDVIGLENTKITNEGLNYLCDLTALDNIDLGNTSISDAGLEILSNITTLECLCVVGTSVTEAGIKKFEEAATECYVTWDGRPV